MNVLSNAVLVAASVNTSPVTSSQESVTTEAPLVTAVVTAASRPLSRQFSAPTYSMWAPGAMVCDASTSSACSSYQPLPPQNAWSFTVAGVTLVNWEDSSGCAGSFSVK